MHLFIGTKTLKALPATRGDYLAYRGWTLPENENPADEGYLVEYVDGGKPNDDRHEGYISWSPKDVFEAAYIDLGQIADKPAHQQRVIGEMAELENKLTKLTAFFTSPVFAGLDEAEQGRLRAQSVAMGDYLEILTARVLEF